jgi:hypothetical protein
VRIRYFDGWEAVDHELVLAAGESRMITDVVDWFGRSGSGPLQVFSSEALTTTSRTYNLSSEGTFGQSFDGVTATGGLESGESVVLMQLREDWAARTNIGVHNQWPRFARVEVGLYDNNGNLEAADTWIIPPLQTVQFNRPFQKFGGRVNIESGYAVITVRSGQEIYVYGSVIDNATGDPTAIPMKRDHGAFRQWLAAAAHSSGVGGSTWRTDVSLLNRSGFRATAEIIFRRDNGDTASLVVEVANGRQVCVGDVVAELGMSGSGSVEIVSDQPLLASSRTYNVGLDGTYGLFLDGLSARQMAASGDEVWLPQLRQDASFRTNIGLVNCSDEAVRVRVFLYDASGNELVSRMRTLQPRSWIQLQEPFSRLAGRSDIGSGSAKVSVASGQGVIAYASVIDNATNDGTAITMKR